MCSQYIEASNERSAECPECSEYIELGRGDKLACVSAYSVHDPSASCVNPPPTIKPPIFIKKTLQVDS